MLPPLAADRENVFFRCVEDSNEAIMITDARGVLVYTNPAWNRIYGYRPEEALGKTPRLLHSGQHSSEFYRDMWEKIRVSGHWKGELVNRAKDGSLVPVFLTITPFRSDNGGELSGYMGIAVDMTYKRDLEAKVAHQDRLASVGMLASGLAHEIGTPLGVVRGRAEYLMLRTQDPVATRNLGVITGEIDRISRLIRSLLRVSRSSSAIQLENVPAAAVAEEVLTLVGQNLREDHVEVRSLIAPEAAFQGDFGRFEQVLLNLVMNATHAIREARKTGRTDGHALTLSSREFGGRLEIRVEDTGCGIPPQNMSRLFKPFFTTKDIGEGTGLGLAIVSQLVREMDGEISVESKVGEGTVFTLSFRVAA